tara:strand:- start:5742 stop:6344 length:603 start_codon:yes stop_codon:yes gene_type:complete
MEDIFTKIYENEVWGDNKNGNYSGSSGDGGSVDYNKPYINKVKGFIKNKKINTIVDLGCGDFKSGRALYDDVDILYTGYDVYKKVIDYHKTQHPEPKYTFKHLDFHTNKESIVEGDMCILKDVLQHWATDDIYIFMDYLIESKKFKYILLVNCCRQSKNDEVMALWKRFRPLTCNLLPLKKYNAVKIGNYKTKEISVITL